MKLPNNLAFAIASAFATAVSDTEKAFRLFDALSTQWRIGMGGATGLDYGAIPVTMRLQGIPRVEWPQLFEDIRTMEAAALVAMRADE